MSWPADARTIPSRAQVQGNLDDSLGDLRGRGGGTVVVLAGEPGMGRSTLLRRLGVTAGRAKVKVIARRVVDGRVETWEPDGKPDVAVVLGATGTAAGWAAQGSMALGQPQLAAGFRGAAAVTSSAGKGAAWLQGALQPELASAHDVEHLLLLLSRTAVAEPVVVLLDDLDFAPGGSQWWRDLVEPLARQIDAGLPVLLVVSVQDSQGMRAITSGTAEGLGEPAESVRDLADRGLASVVRVSPVVTSDLAALIGPDVEPALNRALVELSGGNLEILRTLWVDWTERAEVVLDERPRFAFAGSLDGRELDALRERALSRDLRRLLDPEEERRARRLLAVAALEGQTFTVAALAAVTGEDVDDVIDLLDDRLCGDLADGRPILVEVDPARVGTEGDRLTLWRYRFVSQETWVALGHLGLSRAEREQTSAALADTLLALYGEESAQVAGTAARLLRDADPARSGALAEQSRDWVTTTALITQARRVGAIVEERGSPQDAQWASEMLDWVVKRLIERREMDEAIEFVFLQYRLADHSGSSWHVGCACLSVGKLVARAGDSDLAIKWFERAIDRADATADKGLSGSILIELAQAYFDNDRREDAVASARRACRIAEKLGAENAVGGLYLALGDTYLTDLGDRREALAKAVTHTRAAGNALRHTLALTRLGEIEAETGNGEATRYWLAQLIKAQPPTRAGDDVDAYLYAIRMLFTSAFKVSTVDELGPLALGALLRVADHLRRGEGSQRALRFLPAAVWACMEACDSLSSEPREIPFASGGPRMPPTDADTVLPDLTEEDLDIPLMRSLVDG